MNVEAENTVMRERARIREAILKLRTIETLDTKIFNTGVVIELISREAVLALLRD
jgi:hypothetical protein